MPRRFLKRLLPAPQRIIQHKSLAGVAHLLQEPNLWHLNRRSVSLATFIGVFMAFVPLPIHMIGAALLCILLRCNVTLAVALVWISNPVTIPPIFYATYRIGAWMMGLPPQHEQFELSLRWFEHGVESVWQPLLMGSFATGLVLATLAYFGVRLLWRIGIQCKWERRRRRRQPHS